MIRILWDKGEDYNSIQLMDIVQYNYDTLTIEEKWDDNDQSEASILALNTLISFINTSTNFSNQHSQQIINDVKRKNSTWTPEAYIHCDPK